MRHTSLRAFVRNLPNHARVSVESRTDTVHHARVSVESRTDTVRQGLLPWPSAVARPGEASAHGNLQAVLALVRLLLGVAGRYLTDINPQAVPVRRIDGDR